MRITHCLLFAMVAIGACGGGNPDLPQSSNQKIVGPSVKTLSHDQLMDVVHECHRYGASDDPRVKYSISYCSAAQNAHSMEGYSTPSSAVVDPSLNKLH